MNLVYVTWNILDGGLDAGSDARLRRQLAVLAGMRPTVAALQECKYWDRDNFRIFHLAEQLLGMRGFLSRSAHDGCHLGLFIREQVGLRVTGQRHERGHPYWHGAAQVITAAEGCPQLLHLASVHLAPSSPQMRLAEAEAFTRHAKDDTAIIAGGDWNALPASGPEPPEPALGRSARKLDRRAAQALEQAGLLDVAAAVKDTTPTVGHHPVSALTYRCDRVYTTLPAEAISSYEVITAADADSDHRPVIAEFDLTRGADGVRTGDQR
jgi:endonuclease/exonuclease/phosphatase family metal-dependent hydrolase